MFFTLVVSSCLNAHMNCSRHFNVDIMILIYKQNVSISLRLSDSMQCSSGYYFRAWALYRSFGTC